VDELSRWNFYVTVLHDEHRRYRVTPIVRANAGVFDAAAIEEKRRRATGTKTGAATGGTT